MSTDHVVVYLDKAGQSRKAPFINLETSSNAFMLVLLPIFKKVLNADRAVPRDLCFTPDVFPTSFEVVGVVLVGTGSGAGSSQNSCKQSKRN